MNKLLTRILRKVMPIPFSGCWIWMGADNGKGEGRAHGQVSIDGLTRYVHRVVYEIFKGPIPDGHHIDHLCRVRLCCNPDHLEAVMPPENYARGFGPQQQAYLMQYAEPISDDASFELID